MPTSFNLIQSLNTLLKTLSLPELIFWVTISIFVLRSIGLALVYRKNGEKSSFLLGLFPGVEIIPKLLISKLPLNIIVIPVSICSIGVIKSMFSLNDVHANISQSSALSSVLVIAFIIAYTLLEVIFLNNINKSAFWVLPLILIFIPFIFSSIPIVVSKSILYIALIGMAVYSIMLIVWGTSKEAKYDETHSVIKNDDAEEDIPENAKHDDGYINPYLASYYEKENKSKQEKQYIPVDNATAYNLGNSLNDKKTVSSGNSGNHEDKFFKSESREDSPRRKRKDEEANDKNIDFDSFVQDKKEE